MIRESLKINSICPSACGGSCIVASNLTSNYVFKPTPEQALRTIWLRCRRGLTRRWTSEVVADRVRALRWKGRICLRLNLSLADLRIEERTSTYVG